MTASRNPWPWAIGIFIGCFALAMASFVVWSLRHRQDLVMPDYYEQDLQYQGQMEAIRRAQALGITNAIALADDGQGLVIRIPGAAGATGVVSLYRPSSATLDRTWPLELDSTGGQRIPWDGKPEGLWRARVVWQQDGHAHQVDAVLTSP